MAALDSNCFQIELMGFEDMEEVLKIERSSFPCMFKVRKN